MKYDSLYASKPTGYFGGERRDLIDQLSIDSTRVILEIGCADGATGAYAKATQKCGRYIGVEFTVEAAEAAKNVIDEVYIGDIGTIDLPFSPDQFDVLIASEVLEHLVDPWAALQKVRRFLKPNALVFASSPNIAHHSTLQMLFSGRWDTTDDGRMDRTHLRWFTPRTYRELFEQSGFNVVSLEPTRQPGPIGRLVSAISGGRLSHLFISQMVVSARPN